MKHSFKEWFAVTRYWSFTVSAMPVFVIFFYLLYRGDVKLSVLTVALLVLTVLGVVILHSAGNVLSDYFDYKTGVDNPEAFAVPNLVFHKFEAKEYLVFSILLFAVGSLIGLVLVLLIGWPLFFICLFGLILTAGYSFLKYHALGDIDIFLIFSVLIMLGTTCVLTGEICYESLCMALPIGIITVSVLHANNTVDIESDTKAGIRTFAAILGYERSSVLYRVYMVLPFVFIILAVILGYLSPWALICLLSGFKARKNAVASKETMSGLDRASSELQLSFSALLSLGLLTAAVLG